MDLHDNEVHCISEDDKFVLKDVVAYVEVRTKTENRSRGVQYQLEQLGANVVSKLSNNVTHLIWKDGKKPTLERARKRGIHVVSVLWVESCKQNQEHVAEKMFPVVGKEEGSPLFVPRTRRRKFMEPKDLEEDLQDSRERLAKRRKRDVPSPISIPGRVLVKDTPYRQSPAWYLPGLPFSPSLIPSTPDSMRACLDKLKAIRTQSPVDHQKPCLGDSPTCATFNSSSSGHCSPIEKPEIVSSLIDRLLYSDTDEPSPLEKVCLASKKTVHHHGDKTKYSKVLFQANPSVYGQDKSMPQDDITGNPCEGTELQKGREYSSPVPTHGDDKCTGVEEVIAASVPRKGRRSSAKVTREDSPSVKKIQPSGLSRRDLGGAKGDIRKTKRSSYISRKGVDSSLNDVINMKSSNGEGPLNVGNDSVSNLSEKPKEPVARERKGPENADVSMEATDSEMRATPRGSKLGRRRSSRRSTMSNPFSQGGQEEDLSGQKKEVRCLTTSRKDHFCFDVVTECPGRISESVKQTTMIDITNSVQLQKGIVCGEKGAKVKGHSKQLSRKSKIKRGSKVRPESESPTVVLDSPEDRLTREQVDEDGCNNSEKGDEDVKEMKKDNKRTQFTPNDGSLDRDDAENSKEELSETPGQKRSLTETSGEDIAKRKPKRRRLLKMQPSDEPPSILIEPKSSSCDNVKEHKDGLSIKRSSLAKRKQPVGGDDSTSRGEAKKNEVIGSQTESLIEMIQPSRRSVEDFKENGTKARKETDVNRGAAAAGKKGKRLKASSLQGDGSAEEVGDVETQERKRKNARSKNRKVAPGNKTRKPTIVLTSMHRSDQDVMVSVVRNLGGYKVTDTVGPTTTHIITGDQRRTLNVLSAIANGCWLLSKEWVLNSLESGYWLPEEPFEVHSAFPAAKISRELKLQSETEGCHLNLFSEFEGFFVSESSSPPKERLLDLLQLCGGAICKSPQQADLCIGECARPADVHAVQERWVLDCISEMKTLPIDSYKILT
ncbi:microcephalin-like isoform X2 [Apostichopus japonicus]|uniref:microcephalin-like isoform X2 n=1 Tax=Stichopus japonicus TaxID=307972 RepID=UPI003AB33BF1